MSTVLNFSRRSFLQASVVGSAGLILGISYRSARAASAATFQPNAFLAIDPSGRVTIWVAKSEMGQGVRTALPLGLCFLPAFVLIGIVPVVAGLVRGLLP